jgi:hypothetical protein
VNESGVQRRLRAETDGRESTQLKHELFPAYFAFVRVHPRLNCTVFDFAGHDKPGLAICYLASAAKCQLLITSRSWINLKSRYVLHRQHKVADYRGQNQSEPG